MSLSRLLLVLVDHKWFITLVALIFLMGGYFYSSSQPRIYQADSLVQIESRGSTMNMLDTLSVGNQINNPTSADLEILQSRMVMGETVDRLDLAIQIEPRRLPLVGNFLVHHGMTQEWFDRLMPSVLHRWTSRGDGGKELGSPYTWAAETLQIARFEVPTERLGKYHVLRVGENGTYQLLFDGQLVLDGRMGVTMNDDASGYRLFVSRLEAHPGAEFQVRRISRLNAISLLQRRLMIIPRGVDSGVFQLTLSGQDPDQIDLILDTLTGVFLTQNVQRQSEEAEKQIEFLNEQLPQINVNLTEAENRLNEYRSKRDSVDLNFETRSLLNGLVSVENKLTELSLSEAELAERFRPSHPNYQSLLRQKNQLETEKARLEEQIEKLPETQQEVLRFTRDTEVNQQVYVQLLNKRQEMRLVKAGTVGNVRILDPAVLQQATISPRIPLTTLLSGLMGVLLAVLTVIMKLVLSRAIENADQLEDMGLPVYAMVPESSEQIKLARRIRARKSDKTQTIFRGLLAECDPGELSIEALRSLRTSLHFAMLESGNNRLMIAGASPEVGKSFISANLAAVCAQSGQKVLLIDADMRRGHLHHAFSESSGEGLSDLLVRRIEFEQAIRNTSIAGLDYVSRGTVPPNPSELLMQQGFREFLEAVSELYDLVILDTPPILAVTDAAVVGKMVGTSLMVVRFGHNPVKEIRVAKRRLENAGVRLKGAILNGIEKSSASRGYYGTYLYAYR